MAKRLQSLWQDRSGATSIEYAVIGAVISIVIIGALQTINGTLTGIFAQVAAAFTSS